MNTLKVLPLTIEDILDRLLRNPFIKQYYNPSKIKIVIPCLGKKKLDSFEIGENTKFVILKYKGIIFEISKDFDSPNEYEYYHKYTVNWKYGNKADHWSGHFIVYYRILKE